MCRDYDCDYDHVYVHDHDYDHVYDHDHDYDYDHDYEVAPQSRCTDTLKRDKSRFWQSIEQEWFLRTVSIDYARSLPQERVRGRAVFDHRGSAPRSGAPGVVVRGHRLWTAEGETLAREIGVLRTWCALGGLTLGLMLWVVGLEVAPDGKQRAR